MTEKKLDKQDVINHFLKNYHNKWGSTWCKLVRPDTNGSWGPKNRQVHTFRSGICVGFMRNQWLIECFKDGSVQIYPQVGDVTGPSKKQKVYADDERSEQGRIFREWFKKDLTQLEEEIKVLEEEKKVIETELVQLTEKDTSLEVVSLKKRGRPRKEKE